MITFAWHKLVDGWKESRESFERGIPNQEGAKVCVPGFQCVNALGRPNPRRRYRYQLFDLARIIKNITSRHKTAHAMRENVHLGVWVKLLDASYIVSKQLCVLFVTFTPIISKDKQTWIH